MKKRKDKAILVSAGSHDSWLYREWMEQLKSIRPIPIKGSNTHGLFFIDEDGEWWGEPNPENPKPKQNKP